MIPIVYFLFPETNGRCLEDMDIIFSQPEHWWQIAAAARVKIGDTERLENSDGKAQTFDDKSATSEQVENSEVVSFMR